jgi:hypothetical protein
MSNRDGKAESTPEAVNPFDPERLALKGAPADAVGVRRALVRLPVRKPNRQEFVQVHRAPEYQMQIAILELKTEAEIYAVFPEVARAIPGETRSVTLKTAITRQGNLFLWPVPLPAPDGRQNAWHQTARAAAERATTCWVRVVANMAAGAYDIWEAEADIAAPDWPDHSFEKLLEIAFGNGRLIDRENHPVLQQLMGRA